MLTHTPVQAHTMLECVRDTGAKWKSSQCPQLGMSLWYAVRERPLYMNGFLPKMLNPSLITKKHIKFQWRDFPQNSWSIRAFSGLFLDVCTACTCTWPSISPEYIRVFQSPHQHLIPQIFLVSVWPASCLLQVISPSQVALLLDNCHWLFSTNILGIRLSSLRKPWIK